MLTAEHVLTIPGRGAPKGSLVCRRDPRHTLREDNKRTKPYRDKIAGWARKLVTEQASPRQPVGVEITWTFDRPAAHYGTGRNRQTLRHAAPPHPSTRTVGDTDKLLRAVLDALQDAGVIRDDAQVVELTGRKAYAAAEQWPGSDVLTYAGTVVRLYPIEETPQW